MSKNQRARRNEKHFEQQRARSLRPSKSAIWNEACERADDLMDQELWSEAREVLEEADRSHPGANCVLNRLADVYHELGETDCLASVNSRRKSNPLNEAMLQQLIDIRSRFDSIDVDPDPQDIVALSFKIDFEPVGALRSPQIQEWAQDAHDALLRNEGREAEVLFKKCIHAAGEAPDLMNNLAAAYGMQGRHTESIELARAVHAKWPDYFFGHIHMANSATSEGRFNVAEQYLRPMLTRERFHITEFRGMLIAYIQLEIARYQLDAAQRWIDLWKSVEPDRDDWKMFQQHIEARSNPNRLLRLLTGWKR